MQINAVLDILLCGCGLCAALATRIDMNVHEWRHLWTAFLCQPADEQPHLELLELLLTVPESEVMNFRTAFARPLLRNSQLKRLQPDVVWGL
jgi:Trp operon repressor